MPPDTEVAEQNGRPMSRGEVRRRAFLDAAAEVFQEQGYEAASVNEVVRRAGGSLATLYAQFGNKDGLFLASLEDGIERVVAPMVRVVDNDKPLAEGLQEMGEAFLTALLAPGGLSYFRMAVGEGRKFPDAMAKFLQVGPDRVRATVALYLGERAHKDNCTFDDCDAAAAYFCEMVRGRHQYRALGDANYRLSETAIKEEVAKVVAFFMKAARAP